MSLLKNMPVNYECSEGKFGDDGEISRVIKNKKGIFVDIGFMRETVGDISRSVTTAIILNSDLKLVNIPIDRVNFYKEGIESLGVSFA